MQVQKELEEERRQAEEQQRLAQEAIQAKVAELRAIEAARRQEVMACPRHCLTTSLLAAMDPYIYRHQQTAADSNLDSRGVVRLFIMFLTRKLALAWQAE